MNDSLRKIQEFLDKIADYGQLGEYLKVIDYCEEILKIDLNNEDAYVFKGMALDRLGRNEDAIIHFKKALEINENNVETLQKLGVSLSKQGKIDDGLQYFSKALSIDPDNALLWFDKGVTYQNNGYIQQAITCFKEVERLKDSPINPWFNLGVCNAQLGKFKESIEYLNKALEENPSDVKIRQYREMIIMESEKFGGKKYYVEEKDDGFRINLGDASEKTMEDAITTFYEKMLKRMKKL